jgi:transposase
VSFLRDDKQRALPPLNITESRSGYRRLQRELDRLHRRYPQAEIYVRIDAAGQYAYNLETFVRSLDLPLMVSVGEPKRNKDYRQAHYPKRKADPVESLAMARYAVVERPGPSRATPLEFASLRRVASRLQAQVKQSTRLTNQLHETLSAAFPELATLVYDVAARWVLTLLKKYPTPQRIAAARLTSLRAIPFFPKDRAEQIRAAARDSVGAVQGDVAEQIVRQLAQALLDSLVAEDAWKELLQRAFDALPDGPHRQIETILGIGKLTTAAIVATAIDIDRFKTEDHFVGYYGVFPEEFSSGVDKFGRPQPPGKKRMCRKGNDLVRGLLWNGAKNAAKTNPAVRALYARLMSKGVRGDVAFGYCMTKLLRLVYAIWKTGRPFDRNHYAWDTTAAGDSTVAEGEADTQTASPSTQVAENIPPAAQENAAGLKEQSSESKEVTAATSSVEQPDAPDKPTAGETDTPATAWIDFAAIRQQVTMEQVLKHLGIFERLRRTGTSRSQYRGTCPIHPGNGERHRSFSVNLDKQAFRCFYPACAAHGNALDLWAAVRGLSLREAGIDMVTTFHLDPARPRNREEEPVKEPVPKPRKRSATREAKTARKERKK